MYKDDRCQRKTRFFRFLTLKYTLSTSFRHLLPGSKKLKKMINHPVHIIDQDNELYPTALVPFCEFSGNMSVMGVKIDQFNVPICRVVHQH